MNQFFLYWVDLVALLLSLGLGAFLAFKVVKKSYLPVRPLAAFFLFFGPVTIAVHMCFHLSEIFSIRLDEFLPVRKIREPITRIMTKRGEVLELWDSMGIIILVINAQAMSEFVVPFAKDAVFGKASKEVFMGEMRFEEGFCWRGNDDIHNEGLFDER